MRINERYRSEILKTIYLIQFDLEKSGEMDWETVHERLSQTAIKEEMWQQAEGGKGLRNNELIVQTFKELEEEGLITVKEGKQKAKLYFLTEHGRAWGKEYLRHEPRRLIWQRGTQTYSVNVNIAKISAFVGLVCFALAAFNGWESAIGWAGRCIFSITPWPGPWGFAPESYPYYPDGTLEGFLPRYGPYAGRFMVLEFYLGFSILLTVLAYRTFTNIEQGNYAAIRPYSLVLGIFGLFPGFGWVLGGLCFLLTYYQLGTVLKTDKVPPSTPKSMVYLGSIIVFNFLFAFVTLFGEIISIHEKLENLFSFGVCVFFAALAILRLKKMPKKSVDKSAWPAVLTSSGVFYGNLLFFDLMAFHFPGWWEWFFMPALYGLIMWTLLRWEMPYETL